jgi:ATP-dependent RNA helicase DDX42
VSDISVNGEGSVRPVKTFQHFGFDQVLLNAIRKEGFTDPTPIQKQAIPIIMSGRDLIGIAKTGSGKTAAFAWPMLVHLMQQRELDRGEGPIAVILAPTRELADQIYLETTKFARGYGVRYASSESQLSTAKHHYLTLSLSVPGSLILL